MGEVFEFPSRREQMKVQLERMLRTELSREPRATVDLVVGDVLAKFDEYHQRLPFRFEINLPVGTTESQIKSIRDYFGSLHSKIEELALENLAMTARLTLSESRDSDKRDKE